MALRFVLRIFNFYKEGFRNLTLGKTLWKIILIKLFIILVVLKIFVFDVNFNALFKDDASKSEFVIKNLTLGEDND
ncbi:DUF4492 domain-containing protein [Campylobacter sp.]|uniref:DUF4492 domain-containing protein n=1 Tax=Campylobacter sp. TaxID=205 RepID=UPI0026DD1F61|nr:DUF4492 domain-containing protein [Campylobacter sp.]MDO4674825.1 DUF4492 domain-containing protein [Campylobacter sp.]